MSYLALADGTVWPGESVGADGHALGEAVFTTGMSGYQEAVTDPSFEDQLICFTAPMVGNYGVAEERSESARTHARAVLMREARGPEWTDWLRDRGVVAFDRNRHPQVSSSTCVTPALRRHRGRRGPPRRGGDRARGAAAVDARACAERGRLDERSRTSSRSTVACRGRGSRLRRQEAPCSAGSRRRALR